MWPDHNFLLSHQVNLHGQWVLCTKCWAAALQAQMLPDHKAEPASAAHVQENPTHHCTCVADLVQCTPIAIALCHVGETCSARAADLRSQLPTLSVCQYGRKQTWLPLITPCQTLIRRHGLGLPYPFPTCGDPCSPGTLDSSTLQRPRCPRAARLAIKLQHIHHLAGKLLDCTPESCRSRACPRRKSCVR